MLARRKKEIKTQLERFLSGAPRDEAITLAVCEAGASKNRDLAPLLQTIAEKTSMGDYDKLTLFALASLQQLKVGPDYFLEKVVAHRENKWLAYFSILLLARNPNHRKTRVTFGEVRPQISDNQLRGCLDQADRVGLLASQYAVLTSPQEKIGFVMAHFRGTWNPLVGEKAQKEMTVDPLATWSQSLLHKFSLKHPELAADAVMAIDRSEDFADPYFTQAYRRYVASFLGKKAQAQFTSLTRAAERAGKGGL